MPYIMYACILHIGIKSEVVSYSNLAKSVDNDNTGDTSCNKDTGEKKALQRWTRGMWFSVNSSGHIHSWQPLYK